jgi:hypothetical protein
MTHEEELGRALPNIPSHGRQATASLDRISWKPSPKLRCHRPSKRLYIFASIKLRPGRIQVRARACVCRLDGAATTTTRPVEGGQASSDRSAGGRRRGQARQLADEASFLVRTPAAAGEVVRVRSAAASSRPRTRWTHDGASCSLQLALSEVGIQLLLCQD